MTEDSNKIKEYAHDFRTHLSFLDGDSLTQQQTSRAISINVACDSWQDFRFSSSLLLFPNGMKQYQCEKHQQFRLRTFRTDSIIFIHLFYLLNINVVISALSKMFMVLHTVIIYCLPCSLPRALGVPITDYSFEDCQLAMAEGQLRLPVDTCLLEFAKLVRRLGWVTPTFKWDVPIGES